MTNSFERGQKRPDSIEEMSPQTISVLGAQGHLGTSLCARLAEIRGESAIVIPTGDKDSNREIVARSDVVMITVRPDQVESLLREISDRPDRLKPDTRIVSFAARYPLASILEITKRPAARVMADPWWNISAAVLGGGFSQHDLDSILGGLTIKGPLMLNSDREIDLFTVLLAHLITASFLKRQSKLPNAEEHLMFLEKKLGVASASLNDFRADGDPAELLRVATTKGGITEALLDTLRARPDIPPEELFDTVSNRFFPD